MAKNASLRKEKRKETDDKRPRAVARYIRMSPFKVREVLGLIRGTAAKPVTYTEAAAILANTNRAAAPVVKKLLDSAAANAENNLSMNKDTLIVAAAYCDPGPTLKRMMTRARGSANRILKRTSHITIVLDAAGGK